MLAPDGSSKPGREPGSTDIHPRERHVSMPDPCPATRRRADDVGPAHSASSEAPSSVIL
jgi:hypothetical protein